MLEYYENGVREMSRSPVIVLGIACIVLVAGLVGVILYDNLQLNTLSEYKATLTTQYNDYVAGHHYTDQQYTSQNASGYEIGLSEGSRTGYQSGYNVGLSEGSSSGYQSGYSIGYTAGVTSRGFNIVDPTYQQMSNFMATDVVHNHQYTTTYVCWNFCNDYINEAFKAGWRCGFVYIDFADSAHGAVCFNTTDRGLMFVEPQSDTTVKVAIGLSYWSSNGYQPVTYNDTIVNFGIIW